MGTALGRGCAPGRYPMIAEQNAPRLIRLLPVAVAATLLVAVAPLAVVWGVRVTGLVSSTAAATACGVVLSLVGSCLGGLWWERRRGSRDVLFGELMIWGWVRRYLIERRLTSAVELLGIGRRRELTFTTESFSAERQAHALEQLAASLEARDPHTHGHSRRVARYTTMIAKRMGLSQREVARIRAAAAMHDVGKIETPVAVLHKPGRLTDAEFEAIKRHPVDGARMVARVGDEKLTAIVRHHHERLDGSGYPSGLRGAEIPLGARIIAVADTFDAITSERPYRAAKAHRQAIAILRREAGTQLDPDAVHAFCDVYFGRRTLGLWIGATSALERVAAWLVAGSTVRVAAIAASTAALGAGAVALPGSAARSSTRAARARSVSALAAAGAGGTVDRAARVGDLARAASAPRRGGRARAVRGAGTVRHVTLGNSAGAETPAPGASSPGGGSAGAGSAGSDSSGSGSGAGGSGAGGGGSGTTVVSTGAIPAAGVPAVAVTSSPGQSGGLPSVGVSVGGTTVASAGGTPTGGVGVSVGGSGGVAVSAGGSGSLGVGVTVGGGSSGLPPVGVSLP